MCIIEMDEAQSQVRNGFELLITWARKKKRARSPRGKQRVVKDGESERYVQILTSYE